MPRHSYKFSPNDTIRTASELSRSEFLGSKQHKLARRSASPGLITGLLGKWYLVQHEDLQTAIYNEGELELEAHAYWRITHTVQGVSYFKEIAQHVDVLAYVDELADQGCGVTAKVEGPFYSDKELSEGPLETRTLFDHLTEDL